MEYSKGDWKMKKCGCADRTCDKYRIDHPLNLGGLFTLADARLIIAAPKLYEACENAVEAMIVTGLDKKLAQAHIQLNQAIKEAKGEN